MALGNFTPFRAKHVTALQFGASAFSEAQMDQVNIDLGVMFTSVNGTHLIDLVGDADTLNPTISYAFAKDFTTTGNERPSSEEALLGADSEGSQNSELSYGTNSKIDVEMTCVYRNPMATSIFNDSTKSCVITLDNSESSGTGVLNLLFNNVVMTHVGSITRNADGLMEQKVKFSVRGGFAGSSVSVTDGSTTWQKYRVGVDYAEEIRLT